MRIVIFSLVMLFTGVSSAQTSVTPPACIAPFYHGVASGDPMSDRVIIWTRVTPSDFTLPVPVSWRMATDTGMVNVVAQGSVLTNASKDYTVKVDVTGLQPNTYYFYEFQTGDSLSPRGRTKTAPVGGVDSLRFAIVSCANLEAGYFNTYRIINERNDVDAVVMLGDYIYEYGTGQYSQNSNVDRTFEPSNEIISLSDYRTRYSIYHMDESLRTLHQNFPWICIWDDHESANDSYKDGAENHNAGEGDWQVRKQYSKQAYFEWMPIRQQAPDNYEIYRTLHYGNLLDFIMLDTRLHGRDEQVSTTSSSLNDASRTMLGDDQLQWFKDELSNSTAQWKVIGNQVIMAKLTVAGVPLNADQWDGYPVTRQAVYDHIQGNNIENVVVVTGDIHTSWAFDLKNSSNRVGVEFVTPSVTSPGSPVNVGGILSLENPHMKYVELTKKGFIILDVNSTRTQADWFYLNTIDQESSAYTWAESLYTLSGESTLQETTTATSPGTKYDVMQVPVCPRIPTEEPETPSTAGVENAGSPQIIGVYPNPGLDFVTINFINTDLNQHYITIMDMSGKVVDHFDIPTNFPAYTFSVKNLENGVYLMKISAENGAGSTVRFVKE